MSGVRNEFSKNKYEKKFIREWRTMSSQSKAHVRKFPTYTHTGQAAVDNVQAVHVELRK